MLPEKRRYFVGTVAVLVGAFALFCALTAASAHTQTVCSVPGDHATIQAAVDDAACETVNVGAGTFYESVTISRTVTIQGQGEDLTMVDGQNDDVIFYIKDSGVVTLTGMTLQNLQAGFGSAILNDGTALVTGCTLSGNSACLRAGILNRSGTMIVTGSTLRANLAHEGCGPSGVGGGIANAGTMTVINSTLSGNSAASSHGGSALGGGIANVGTMTLINSTLSGNSADSGGSIYNDGTMTVTNSTLSGNSAADGGGIYNDGTMTVTNSIVANSPSGADCSGAMTSLGHNIDSDGSCGLTAAGDLPNTDPLLGPLQDNGGPTLTHALLEGSPAIDAGSDTCPATDQRGALRPWDGDGDGLARCDIGAFELSGEFSVFLPLIAR